MTSYFEILTATDANVLASAYNQAITLLRGSYDEDRRYAKSIIDMINTLDSQAPTYTGSSGSFKPPAASGSKNLFDPFIGGSAPPIKSFYGYRVHPIHGTRKLHTGIDFGAAQGTKIYASIAGIVTSAGWLGGYGNAVVIKHNGADTTAVNTPEVSTLYGHLSKLLVSVGQNVSIGEVIGEVGSTGYSTGAHLHFEVHLGSKVTDPLPYLAGRYKKK